MAKRGFGSQSDNRRASESPRSDLWGGPLSAALERRNSRLLERRQTRAVDEESTRIAQRPGRDAAAGSSNNNGGGGSSSSSGSGSRSSSQRLAWSAVKRAQPWRWHAARLAYRLETFLESATHRFYALIAVAALVSVDPLADPKLAA
jgi:hypothetical protein